MDKQRNIEARPGDAARSRISFSRSRRRRKVQFGVPTTAGSTSPPKSRASAVGRTSVNSRMDCAATVRLLPPI
jgi:hypothetical protein